MAKRPISKRSAAKKAPARKSAKKAAKPRTHAQAEPAGATGGDLLGSLDRGVRRAEILRTLEAVGSRTSRVDGPMCVAFKRLNLAVQFEAACAYLLDMQSASQVREAYVEQLAAADISDRVFERFIKIVKDEYAVRISRRLSEAETEASLAAISGDLPALSGLLWCKLVTRAMQYVESTPFEEMDNTTRHLLQRVAEGATDHAKVSTEVERTRAQTAKLMRQLRQEVAEVAKRNGGKCTAEQLGAIVDQVLGLAPVQEVAA